MNARNRFAAGVRRSVSDRKSALALASTIALAGMLSSSSARAASATWTGGTNNNWESAPTETNWSTGAGNFPGTTSAGSITSTDVATFSNNVNSPNIAINATSGNSLPLNIGGVGFTGTTLSTNYVIGSTTGNALVATSDSAQGTTTYQMFISGGGRSSATAPAIIATINAPIILAAQNSSSPAFYTFQNNSTANGNLDKLVFNGNISGGATTSTTESFLTLRGGNTNAGNVINGSISNGGIGGIGLGINKSDGGTWTLAGSNSYSGDTIFTAGTLNITGSNSGNGNYNITNGSINFNTSGSVLANLLQYTAFGGSYNILGGTVIANNVSSTGLSAFRFLNVNGGVLQVNGTIFTGSTPAHLQFNGGTIRAGTSNFVLDSTNNNPLNHTADVLAGGATLDTSLANFTSQALLNGTAGGGINISGGKTVFSNINNNGVLNITGSSTWDMNSTSGASATFQASSVGGLSGSGTVVNSNANPAALTLNVTSATPFTFSGNIAPSTPANVSLIKTGSGTQIFSGSGHTFSGGVNLSAGTLSVTGSLTSSTVTVNGGFLSGNGNGTTTGALGTVVLGSGGTLAPGVSSADGNVGTMSIASLDGTVGAERFDLVSPGASDTLNVGSATFSSANTFTLLGTPVAGKYTLVNSATPLAGAGPTVAVPTGTRSTFVTNYGTVNPNVFSLTVTGNAAALTWTGATNNVWDFGTAGTTNWNNGTTADKFYNLDSVTFGNGAANESISLNTTVQPTSVTVNNDGSNTYTISGTGAITGLATSVTKLGVGTFIVATNNSYSGGTNISSGIVQVGSGGPTGSLGSGPVIDNGGLVFNLSSGTTLGTAVSGTGTLRQSGTGPLILTGSNTYTGSTIIDTGTVLQLGNGGTTGNVASTSDVQNNGTLIFNRTNSYTLSAPITGTGSLQVSAGTLSLGANCSYTGTTLIAAGATLQVGSGGTVGSVGTGALTNNGTLAFNRSDTLSAPALSGIGGLQQNGSGNLQLNSAGSYTGPTTLSNGTLSVRNVNGMGNTAAVNISGGSAVLSFQSDSSATFARPADSTPYLVNITGVGGTIDVNQLTATGTAAKTITIGNVSAASSTTTGLSLTFTGANNTGLTIGQLSGPTSSAPTVTINNNNVTGTTTLTSYQSNNTNGSGIETLNFQGSGNTLITGGIQNGAGDMNINFNGGVNPGTGTVTILGSSNFGGNLTGTSIQITNGTVAIGNDNAFGNTTSGNASLEILNLNAPDPAVGVIQSADTNTRTIGNTLSQSSTNFTYGATGTGNLVFTNVFNKGQFPKNMIVNCPVVTLSGGIFSTGSANGDGTFGLNGALTKSGPGSLVLTADSSVSQVTSGPNFNGLWLSTPVDVNAGTLVVANGLTNGSATGTNDVVLNGGTLASDPTNGGAILGNVLAGTGAHVIAPGGVGSIGTLEAGGLTTSNLTTLNFDLGTGTGVVTNGDLLLLGYTTGTTPVHAGSVSIGSGTNLTFAGTPVIGDDYRLIGDFTSGAFISGISLANFSLPAAPSEKSYSLSTTVDPGYIDLVVGVGPSGPSNLTWNNAGGSGNGTTWDTAQINWNNGSGVVAYSNNSNTSTGDNVTFNDTNNGHYAVTISGVVNPSSVIFNNTTGNYTVTGTNSSSGIAGPASLTKLGTGTVTISSSNTYAGGTNVSGGKLVVASAAAFPNNGSAGTALTVGAGAIFQVAAHGSGSSYEPVVSSLANGGLIDITNNEMLFKGASLTTIQNQVAAALNTNGTWKTTGNGLITSSTVTGITTVGVATVGSDVLVRATYYGDANLDGSVSSADYTKIDNGFLTHATGWQNGDFNYDNVINGSDYTLIDNAFNTQGAALSSQIASPTAQVGGGAVSAVPEPTGLGLIGMSALGLLRRRIRRSS